MNNEVQQQGPRPGIWSSIGFGLAVVAIGLVFLLDNLGLRLPFTLSHNWWAWFILIGAVPMLVQAVERYRRIGQVDRTVIHLLLSAAAPALVAAFFLLDLRWDIWWPLFVIYGGLWVMMGGRKNRQP